MNLKYYLRGLGLGIIMTAVIMGMIWPKKEETLTDSEIAERAKELGMIEETELAGYLEEAKAETEERVRREAAEEYEKKELAEGENNSEENQGENITEPEAEEESELEGSQEPEGMLHDGMDMEETKSEEETNEPEKGNSLEGSVVFTVKKGEPPYSIEERLKEGGLIPREADFDKFLVDNGYDRKVVAAEYTIPADADMEMIAKIITGQK